MTAYDAEDRQEAWADQLPASPFNSLFGTGPQATPAVVGGKVYTFGATGVLTCFDAEQGRLWLAGADT